MKVQAHTTVRDLANDFSSVFKNKGLRLTATPNGPEIHRKSLKLSGSSEESSELRSQKHRQAVQQVKSMVVKELKDAGVAEPERAADRLFEPLGQGRMTVGDLKEIAKNLDRRIASEFDHNKTDAQNFKYEDGFGALGKLLTGGTENVNVALNKMLKDLEQDQKSGVKNPGGLTLSEFTKASIGKMIESATAEDLRKFDTDIYEHHDHLTIKGRSDQANLLQEIAKQARVPKSPDGARNLFNAAAVHGVKTEPEKTFLRGSGNDGTTALKKLYDGIDGGKFSKEVKDKLPEIQNAKEWREFDNYTLPHKTLIGEDDAKKIANLAVRIAHSIGDITVKPETNSLLRGLIGEMSDRADYDTNGEQMARRLIGDQLILKDAVPALLGNAPPAHLRMAVQMLQTAVNEGGDSSNKLNGPMLQAYKNSESAMLKELNPLFDSILT